MVEPPDITNGIESYEARAEPNEVTNGKTDEFLKTTVCESLNSQTTSAEDANSQPPVKCELKDLKVYTEYTIYVKSCHDSESCSTELQGSGHTLQNRMSISSDLTRSK